MKKPKIFIVCSGLGIISRAYESFFRDCFDALRDEPLLDIYLFKGHGPEVKNEISIWNIPRGSIAARFIGKMIGRGGYFVEQFTFFLGLLPHIVLKKPDLIYVSDVALGNFLRLIRKMIKFRYKVLFNNNGPVTPQLLTRWDHIQQVSPEYYKAALDAGVAPARQTLLPSAVYVPKKFSYMKSHEKVALKHKLGLPQDRKIILSVGAINRSRKRMDFLIREVAKLPAPRPYLLLLGQIEADSQSIVDLGKGLLSENGFCVKTVEKNAVSKYYQLADFFTLASLDEGFGLVYVEALSHGLPCLVHDYKTSRFVLGDMGYYSDLTQEGSLSQLISSLKEEDFNERLALLRHDDVYKRFSWDCLKSNYIELFQKCPS